MASNKNFFSFWCNVYKAKIKDDPFQRNENDAFHKYMIMGPTNVAMSEYKSK